MTFHAHKRNKILTLASRILTKLKDDLLEWDLEEEKNTLDFTSQRSVFISIFNEPVEVAFFLGRLVDGDGKPIAARLKDAFGEDRAFSVDFGLTNRRHGQKNSVSFG